MSEFLMEQAEYVRDIVGRLAAIPVRAAASEGEREAGRMAAEELRSAGFTTSEEEFDGPPRTGPYYATMLTLGCVGLLLGFSHPLSGAVMVVAALSVLLKLDDFRSPAPAWLPGSGRSLNVVGAAEVAQPRINIVLAAHMDAGQAGLMFHPFFKRLFGRINALTPRPRGPLFLPALALAAGLVVLIARACGADGWLPGLFQWASVTVCGVAALVCLQWALAPHTPGAIDNASGVAALIAAARTLSEKKLDRSNIYFVATGNEEAGLLGMRAFCDRHRDLIEARPTYFINFESIGGGELVCVASEGMIKTLHYPPRLNGLAQAIARRQGMGELRAVKLMAITDSAVPVSLGHEALCLIALDRLGMPPNYHELTDTAEAVDCGLIVKAAELAIALCVELDRDA